MADLFSRYESGDCQAVRDLLRQSINDDSLPEDIAIARAVADSFVSRAVENLSRLYHGLKRIEYQFDDPPNAFVLNDPPDDASVGRFEDEMGRLPTLVSRWYRRIRSVNFSQTYEQFTDSGSPLAGLGWNTPFIVQSLEKARAHWKEHCSQTEKDNVYREKAGLPRSVRPAPALLTGGCASNNDCKGFDLPSSKFDDVFYNDGAGDQYFGDEIAAGLRCRGFPILSADERTLKLVCSLYGKPNPEAFSTELPNNFQDL